jgi:uncharacterized protein (DUF885 family)
MKPLRLTSGLCGLLWLGALACGGSAAPSAPTPKASTPATPVTGLADELFTGFLERVPESATVFGVANGPHDRLTDLSPGARKTWEAREDAWLARLQAMDTSKVIGTSDAPVYAIIRQTLEANRASRVCRLELWNVSQLFGWQVNLPRLTRLQRLGTPEARAQALARWQAIPRFIDQDIANLREGLREGYTAPRVNVEEVLKQVDALLADPPEKSPFAGFVERDSTPDFRDAIVGIVRDRINPALRRYRGFLADEYMGRARTTPGVSANPNGAECYRARLQFYTTLPLDPREVHELGLSQMKRIEAEMQTVAQRSFGTTDVPALLERLRTDSQYTFRTRQEVIAVAESSIVRARAVMPKWFGKLPKAPVIVDPCQPFEEASGCPGSYVPAAEDGSRPARYRINAGDPTHKPRASAEATAFHETIPGHHLQIAIAQERQGVHPITRFFFNSGFVEGWALYAERVADEMGLYTSDLDRMGLLSNDALRAARLVVDAGIHALGWSRQQAIDYMMQHTAQSKGFVESEVDRYIITPGQATAYMVGRLEIQRLRAEAEQRLGKRFDIREFHDHVLQDGSIPLGFLRSNIERWLAGAPATAAAAEPATPSP